MNHPEGTDRPAVGEPLDEADFAVLGRLRALFHAADPMPADLPELIRFSLTLRDLEFEVARLSAEEDQPVAAVRSAERSRTVTFDSDSLTIMIRIDSNQDGSARVDGWLAPAQPRTIDLRTDADVLSAAADDRGRFVFTRVPRGRAQFVVRAGHGSAGSGQSVVTPALIL